MKCAEKTVRRSHPLVFVGHASSQVHHAALVALPAARPDNDHTCVWTLHRGRRCFAVSLVGGVSGENAACLGGTKTRQLLLTVRRPNGGQRVGSLRHVRKQKSRSFAILGATLSELAGFAGVCNGQVDPGIGLNGGEACQCQFEARDSVRTTPRPRR